jgi:hypothetical protein
MLRPVGYQAFYHTNWHPSPRFSQNPKPPNRSALQFDQSELRILRLHNGLLFLCSASAACFWIDSTSFATLQVPHAAAAMDQTWRSFTLIVLIRQNPLRHVTNPQKTLPCIYSTSGPMVWGSSPNGSLQAVATMEWDMRYRRRSS